MSSKMLIRAWAVLVLSTFASASDPRNDQYCFLGCQQAIGNVQFGGPPEVTEDNYYAVQCENVLRVQSTFLCARTYCTAHELESGWEYASAECEENSSKLPSLHIIDNITIEDTKNMSVFGYEEYLGMSETLVNDTIISTQELAELGERTVSWAYGNTHNHLWYSKALFIFWGIVIGIGVCANIISLITKRLPSPASHPESSFPNPRMPLQERIWNPVRVYFLLPATFRKTCSIHCWFGTIPPRAETVLICAYAALNIILGAVSYSAFDRNLYWDSHKIQIWGTFPDRMGYMSYANLAIFFAFGIRNNILIWMTGWSFPTFNRFHRWTARIATLQAILHSIGYTVYVFLDGGFADYSASWKEQYWYCGAIATITMSLLLPFSIWWLRVSHYDLFLIIHIALSVMTIVGLFYHTKIFDGMFDGYLWPCVAFWVFDRLCRIGRVVYFALHNNLARAMVECPAEEEIVRIDMTDVFRNSRVSGGVYFFLYSPFTLLGWQSHPFTLVRWIRLEGSRRDSISSASEDHGNEKTMLESTKPVPPSNQSPIEISGFQSSEISKESIRYSFLVRPYKGYTGRLRRSLIQRPDPTPLRFLYEGPYGHVHRLDRFAEVLLVIGGSGISVGISYIYNTLEQNPGARMKLVWTCRSASSYVDSILSKELRFALASGRLEVEAFLTGAARRLEGRCKSVAYERPDVARTIRDAAAERAGSMAVVVCGPASLADDARAAFVAELKAGQAAMELFLEQFAW